MNRQDRTEFTEKVAKPIIFVALSIIIFVFAVDSAFQILDLI
jgi:hypothetical protein